MLLNLESRFLSLQPVDYQVGDVVYRQGDRSDWIGIVLRGKLEYYVQPRQHCGLGLRM